MTATEGTEKAPRKAPAKKAPETLGQALAAFQADLPDITLDGVNPHFKSKYATLSGITKKVMPALSANGLAFSVGSIVDNGLLVLDAHLIHVTSGESRSAQFPINETNPQKVGSAVSYYRRYALSALTGIVADEDDDGNVASAPAPRAVTQAQQKKESPTSVKRAATGSRAAIITQFIDTKKASLEDVNWLVGLVQKELKSDEKTEAVYAETLKRLGEGERK